jgi:hypothetical protein
MSEHSAKGGRERLLGGLFDAALAKRRHGGRRRSGRSGGVRGRCRIDMIRLAHIEGGANEILVTIVWSTEQARERLRAPHPLDVLPAITRLCVRFSDVVSYAASRPLLSRGL